MQDYTKFCSRNGSSCNVSLQQEFLPALFSNVLANGLPGHLACLPVKKAGLAIPNPTLSTELNWTASTVICGHLIVVIWGQEVFWLADHSAIMAAGKAETRACHLSEFQDKLDLILNNLPSNGRSRTIKRGEQTGAWLYVLPSTINGTKLFNQ
jgi:hypothetical protein